MTQPVAQQIALARKHRLTRRRHKVPYPRYPARIEADYAHRLVGLVNHWRHAARHLIAALPHLLRRDARLDAAGDQASRIMMRLRAETARSTNDTAAAAIAGDYGRRVAIQQKNETLRQARAALGVDVAIRDPRLAGALEQFVHENAALIRDVHTETLAKLETLIHRGISTGMPQEQMGDLIAKRFKMSENRARFIARDQIARLNSKMAELRYAELGVREFAWWTMRDPHVRPRHKELHDKRFAYHNPPDIGLPGNTSDGPGCRCVQRAIWSSILADVSIYAELPTEILSEATRIGSGLRIPG